MSGAHKLISYSGEIAIVDAKYFEQLSKYKWFMIKGYFVASVNKHNKALHQFIMPKKIGFQIDHINRNPLDNRRVNLRYVTKAQNQWNRTAHQTNNTSGYRGVNRCEGRWRVRIQVNTKRIEIGQFHEFEDALSARREAERQYYGKYC